MLSSLLSLLLGLSALSSNVPAERDAAARRLLWVAPCVTSRGCPEADHRLAVAQDRWRSAVHHARVFAVCIDLEERWNIGATEFAVVEDADDIGLLQLDIDHAFGMWSRVHKIESAVNESCERFYLWYRTRGMDPPHMPYGP